MSRDTDNERFVRDFQTHARGRGFYPEAIDGWAGTATRKAASALCGFPSPKEISPPTNRTPGWPNRDEASLRAFYGEPGSRQVMIDLPYPMRLAWDPDTVVTRTRCHELVADSLVSILETLRSGFGEEGLRHHRLDMFGGVFNLRKMRDRNAWSTHAWGIAIDLDPVHNGLRTPWPSLATMPVEAVEIFEAAGWTSLGRVIGRDAMHFQASRW